MRLKKTYSSREVAALTGLSARQLQLWDAGGLLSPTIPSHKTEAGGYTERRYTPIADTAGSRSISSTRFSGSCGNNSASVCSARRAAAGRCSC
jgi:hypothetical protein